MLNTKRFTLVVALAWVGMIPGVVLAEEPGSGMVGAEAAVQGWEQPAAARGDAPNAPVAAPLAGDLDAFAEDWPQMPRDEAARGWLFLYDRWVEEWADEATADAGFGAMHRPAAGDPVDFADVVAAMPGPAVWPTLVEQIDARSAEGGGAAPDASGGGGGSSWSELALRVLGHALVNDAERVEADVAAALARANSLEPWQRNQVLEALMPLTTALSDEDDAASVRESVEARIQAVRRGDDAWSFDVPDLVTLLGEEDARALLEQIVLLPVDRLDFEAGDATRKLAKQIVIEKVDQLPQPRWRLVDDLSGESVELYEKLDARFLTGAKAAQKRQGGGGGVAQALARAVLGGGGDFEEDDSEPYDLQQARAYYTLGLIAANRPDDAAAYVKQHFSRAGGLDLPYGAVSMIAQRGLTREAFAFAERMVAEPEGAPLWELYIRLGAQVRESDRVLDKVEQAAKQATGEQRKTLLSHLTDARLAAGQVEAGVEALREHVALAESENRPGLYLQLARLGLLLDREDWLEEGVEKTRRALSGSSLMQESSWRYDYAVEGLAELLTEKGRFAEAEALLIDQVRQAAEAVGR